MGVGVTIYGFGVRVYNFIQVQGPDTFDLQLAQLLNPIIATHRPLSLNLDTILMLVENKTLPLVYNSPEVP